VGLIATIQYSRNLDFRASLLHFALRDNVTATTPNEATNSSRARKQQASSSRAVLVANYWDRR